MDLLRAAGHDTLTVFDQSLGGQPDRSIASVCKREGRALITLDADFSDLRTYRPADYPGLLVLRQARQSVPEVMRLMRRMLDLLTTDNCHGQLWIVERDRIKVRT